MKVVLAKGFAAYAEQLAEDIRGELGIGVFGRLDPHRLAAHLEIPVWPLTGLRSLACDTDQLAAIDQLAKPESTALSAMTVFSGRERVVVYNDAHSPARQSSSICHELAHGLLLHEPSPALNELGCRDWDQSIEEEADRLGATLLVPGKAARGCITIGKSPEQVAAEYGCSIQLARWRLNTSTSRARRALTTRRLDIT